MVATEWAMYELAKKPEKQARTLFETYFPISRGKKKNHRYVLT
jgi:hypothetical protein